MGETKDTHIVEIPVDQEHNHHKNVLCSMTSNMIEAIEDHPLTEISESPGHLLLLKLWQREEELFSKRIAHKETRMDTIKAELFQLSSFFFIFHAFFLTLLFTSWAKAQQQAHHSVCHKWWLPSMVSLCTSFVFVVLVQVWCFLLPSLSSVACDPWIWLSLEHGLWWILLRDLLCLCWGMKQIWSDRLGKPF
uniref:Transmembrane protein n=1 Tax=Glycine max TaxID=3847 RepID=A0A0R0J6M0_SOYBN